MRQMNDYEKALTWARISIVFAVIAIVFAIVSIVAG